MSVGNEPAGGRQRTRENVPTCYRQMVHPTSSLLDILPCQPCVLTSAVHWYSDYLSRGRLLKVVFLFPGSWSRHVCALVVHHNRDVCPLKSDIEIQSTSPIVCLAQHVYLVSHGERKERVVENPPPHGPVWDRIVIVMCIITD